MGGAAQPVPDEEVVVAAAGDEDRGVPGGHVQAADELRVREAVVFDDVRLRHAARDTDVLVAVGGYDVGSRACEAKWRGV